DFPRDSKPVDLRLLTRPVFRFEPDNDPRCLDGAIFAFVNGTAPPAFLLFVARKVGTSYQWHFAWARLATGAVAATYGGKGVYSVEKYDLSKDPKRPYFWQPPQPVPKQ